MTVIDVEGLTREYRRGRETVTALAGIDLLVEEGEVLGLLGPNGAGKTTLARILTTLLLPTSGRASVTGFDVVESPREVRSRIGLVLGGERGLYGRLSTRQNLHYWAALCQIPRKQARSRIDTLIEEVGLSARAAEPVERFSRGMLQRVHLARALVADPDVLILDEPTAGMDPNAAAGFRRLVRRLRSEGKTILMATHDMAEADELCSRVTLIDRGRILATDTPQELTRRLDALQTVTGTQASRETANRVAALAGVLRCDCTEDGRITATVETREGLLAVLHQFTADDVRSISTQSPGLADVYQTLITDREFTV